MDSVALYQACRRDGSDAQVDAFEQLSAYLFRIALAMLHDRAGGPDLAADCMQQALVRIYRGLDQCHTPEAFTGWAAQIVRRCVIDAVRHDLAQRSEPLPEGERLPPAAMVEPPAAPDELGALLRAAIQSAPLSDRSRRVVIGRFFAEHSDEALARAEGELAGQAVLPSHIQVTRAKNLAKLRSDSALVEQLRAYVGEG
jgi:RNA polymerase sigma factor (sigma-70 family)